MIKNFNLVVTVASLVFFSPTFKANSAVVSSGAQDQRSLQLRQALSAGAKRFSQLTPVDVKELVDDAGLATVSSKIEANGLGGRALMLMSRHEFIKELEISWSMALRLEVFVLEMKELEAKIRKQEEVEEQKRRKQDQIEEQKRNKPPPKNVYIHTGSEIAVMRPDSWPAGWESSEGSKMFSLFVISSQTTFQQIFTALGSFPMLLPSADDQRCPVCTDFESLIEGARYALHDTSLASKVRKLSAAVYDHDKIFKRRSLDFENTANTVVQRLYSNDREAATILMESKPFLIGKEEFEVDGLISTSKAVLVVEAKTALNARDVEQLERTIRKLKAHWDSMGLSAADAKMIQLGLVTGVFVTETACEEVMDAVRRSAETIVVVVNDGTSYNFFREVCDKRGSEFPAAPKPRKGEEIDAEQTRS